VTSLPQRADAALIRLAEGPRRRAMTLIALIALAIFLPGFFSLPPVDRDETRFAQASRQMVQNGDPIDIRLGEGTRYKKPVGIYWLQSAALVLVGAEYQHEIWVYRLPSLVAAVAACLLTYLIALSLMGARAALLAAFLLAPCIVLGGEARLAKTDAVLLATILAALWPLARLHIGGGLSRGRAALFWVALAASVLVKGPVGPMVIGLTVAALCFLRRGVRWLAPLRPVAGVILFLAVSLPWFAAITLKSGGAFWEASLGRDMFDKLGEAQESHGAPFGAYALAVWVTFWPASILLPFGLRHAYRARQEPAMQFCLAWVLPAWLVFEVTETKLIHYVLPLYPALAMLAAAGWLTGEGRRPGRVFLVFLGMMLALALIFPAAVAGYSVPLGARPGPALATGVFVSVAGIVWVWRALRTGARLAAAPGFELLAVGFALSVFVPLSGVGYLWPSVALARIERAADLCKNAAVVTVGYNQESLMLLTDRLPVFAANVDEAAARAEDADCALVLVDAADRTAFEALVSGRDPVVAGEVRGFAIGNGRRVDITAFVLR